MAVHGSTINRWVREFGERCSLFCPCGSPIEGCIQVKSKFRTVFLDFLPTLTAVVSSAKITRSHESDFGWSFTKIQNRIGPNTVPCGIPDSTASQDEKQPLTWTRCWRFVNEVENHCRAAAEHPKTDSSKINQRIVTRSYALLRSKQAASTSSPLCKAICHWSVRTHNRPFAKFLPGYEEGVSIYIDPFRWLSKFSPFLTVTGTDLVL